MSKQIEILGETFKSEEEARQFYTEDLRKHLLELKQIDGFPIGEDVDILALSNPPYYTACPNPYINEFIEKYGTPYNEETDNYHREPFVGDVSEGKNDSIYNAHSYHTKVPYKAITKFIEHYTDENDIVLDAFAGSGMASVAAQLTNRKAIISDLSPIASFISYNYNKKIDLHKFKYKITESIQKVLSECEWMYKTKHTNGELCDIQYVVWSDVFISPYTGNEFIYWDVAVDNEQGKVLDEFTCPESGGILSKKDCERAQNIVFDDFLNKEIEIAKQVPVLIKYKYNGKSYEKRPDSTDLELINKIEKIKIPYWFPTDLLPEGYNLSQPKRSHNFLYAHQFYTKRNLFTLSCLYNYLDNDTLFLLTSIINRASKRVMTVMSNYFKQLKGKTVGGWAGKPMMGTLYVPSISTETSILVSLKTRLSAIEKLVRFKLQFPGNGSHIISVNSATKLPISNNTVDYIFTDPPFGENIMYSELSFFWEGWLKVFTQNNSEAIINSSQNKELPDYFELMLQSFKEYYRVLKPKRWITVEFHNSKSSVWNSIQEAMMQAGFIVAQVSVLDKKQGSFKQVTASGSVKSDLVISAYKPSKAFEEGFLKNAGEGLEIDFIHEFLHQQPKRPLVERTEKMLYSKMLSYYIQHGYEVRYDAKAFYQMLRENFAEEDGYWFNANQINSYMEYKKKMKLEGIDEIKQGAMMMFVTDEKSALVWLHNFLNEPKSFSDIHTAFTQLANIQGDEVPELRELLEQNFISENGLFRRPQSEPEKNSVIEKREKQLMRQFESLLIQAQTEKKKIKTIRKEAVQLGFEQCYKEKRFRDILTLSGKLDKKILEENAELNEFVEAAEIMVSGLS